mmetsp:Transcript_23788/g.23484  ORF Transcript_23788/g.23484 Transcript_23788/m.23484 type:complete len:158 (-) Transcript_23788:401-874(-)
MCGTNVFILGQGKKRIMIDAGSRNYWKFIRNLKSFVTSQEVEIEAILITHSHYDHLSGVSQVLDLLAEVGQSTLPGVYLRQSKSKEQKYVVTLQGYFDYRLKDSLRAMKDGDVFHVDDTGTIQVISTPGHWPDHSCFLFKHSGDPTLLFTGDHILGS